MVLNHDKQDIYPYWKRYVKEVILMVSLEELKKQMQRESSKFKGVGLKIAERREKQKVKQAIRKIKAARFRGQFGLSKENVESIGKVSKGIGKSILKASKVLAKGAIGAGEAANKYYGVKPKKRR